MTVADLIKALQDMPQDAQVRMLTDSQSDKDAREIGRPEFIAVLNDDFSVEEFCLISYETYIGGFGRTKFSRRWYRKT